MTENNNRLGKFHLDGISSAHVACLRRSTPFFDDIDFSCC